MRVLVGLVQRVVCVAVVALNELAISIAKQASSMVAALSSQVPNVVKRYNDFAWCKNPGFIPLWTFRQSVSEVLIGTYCLNGISLELAMTSTPS